MLAKVHIYCYVMLVKNIVLHLHSHLEFSITLHTSLNIRIVYDGRMALLRHCWHIHYDNLRSQASIIASSFIKPPEKKAFDPEDLLVDAKIALFNDYFNMFRFCDLPRELRDLVYLHYFCPDGDRYIQVDYPWTDEDGSIYQGFVAQSRSRFKPKEFDTALLYATVRR